MAPAFPTLFASILGFVLIGTALVALVWDMLNQLMTGHVDVRRVATGAVGIFLLAVLLRLLARAVWRWEGRGERAAERMPSGMRQ
ncbi:MAG TPA: hypothetical protein VHJ69_06195 [Gemmatimonadales bacterium]|jgi:uncharacterized membrane protein YidH (DUF202 family)|nr:hypothetical protein [Gemmatimonadales bacterium]